MESDFKTIDEAMSLFFQTMKRPQRWAAITAQAGIDLDRPAAFILQTLLINQGQRNRVQDLAAQLGIEAPSVTRKTQELEQAGYLRRTPDPNDGRAIDLEVTPAGRAIGERLWEAQRASTRQVLRDWPAADRRQFVNLFKRFSQDITDYHQDSYAKQTERND